MRFMLLVKGTADSEAGRMPTTDELTAMGAFNEELVKAGVLLDGDGLSPSSKGARVTFTDKKVTVTDGPFAEAKELISGYWVLDVPSLAEAIEWARRVPFKDGEIEVRTFVEAADFGDAFTPELQEREAALREQSAQQRG
jgi:hypothetical protein